MCSNCLIGMPWLILWGPDSTTASQTSSEQHLPGLLSCRFWEKFSVCPPRFWRTWHLLSHLSFHKKTPKNILLLFLRQQNVINETRMEMAESQRLVSLLMSLCIGHRPKCCWPVLPWRSREPAELPGGTPWARPAERNRMFWVWPKDPGVLETNPPPNSHSNDISTLLHFCFHSGSKPRDADVSKQGLGLCSFFNLFCS